MRLKHTTRIIPANSSSHVIQGGGFLLETEMPGIERCDMPFHFMCRMLDDVLRTLNGNKVYNQKPGKRREGATARSDRQ